MRSITLSTAARDALATATATDTTVHITAGQLSRTVYGEVDRALKAIAGGGRWHTGKKAHVFQRDPRPDLAALLDTGLVNAQSFYATPPELATRLVDLLDVVPRDDRLLELLEPSAGNGALVHALREEHTPAEANIDAVEIDLARSLQIRGADVYHLDFAQFAEFTGGGYDGILMNPPFATPDDQLAYITHIELAWSLLVPGGRLVAVAAGGFAYRTDKRIAALRERVEEAGTWQRLPSSSFAASGTDFETLVIEVTA